MDIISSLNTAFTQVQRSENMSFGTNGNGTQVGYRERESVTGATGLPGGRGGLANFLPTSSSDPLASAVQNAVAYDRSEGGGLQLRTQEGDIVKIKFLNSESANAQNQQFESGGTTISDFSMSGSSSSQFKVVVEGDLNGEELSAIRDVLIQAREMTNTFFDGEVQKAFSLASQFSIDSAQLANVNMQLSVSETYTYAQASAEVQVAQTPDPVPQPTLPIAPAVDSAPPAAPAVANPADLVATLSQPNVNVSAPAVDSSASTGVTQEAPVRPEPVETQVHSDPDPVDNLAGALSTITSFLSQLTETLSAFNQQPQGPSQGNGGSAAFSFSAGFQLQVMSSLIGQMETDGVGQVTPAGELAVKTMDELAMKMDAHVDALI